MLATRYDPADAERRLYAQWEEAGCFRPSGDTAAAAYSIVIPPPNVTGVLHMGHALNNTLQDVLVRFERMRGKNVLWQTGTDHAGIATQMVVERQLAAEGNEDRRSLGREAFIERVWDWREESGGRIIGQLKRLGASCDWSRERFTMGSREDPDNQMVRAVRKVFVDLYNTVKDEETGQLRARRSPDETGLIYRDKRLVNWDPHFQTAISDLEVEQREVKGQFWHLRYPLADGVTYEHPIAFDEAGEPTGWETRDYLVVATTRPETMLGDTGVAVNPGDTRYAGLVGKFVDLPIVGRRIPIVADEHADPEQGSGAVKITPAHDFNDFEVGRRAGLQMDLNILTERAEIVSGIEARLAGIPEDLRGLDRFEARRQVVARFEAAGLLQEVEDKVIQQPFGDRSGVVIEPLLTDQWYVDAKTLAEPAIAAVREGKTRFVPENWAKTYFNWLEDIQPWCISRQLWWGHRIPVWYGPGESPGGADPDKFYKVFVAETQEEAKAAARQHYGDQCAIEFVSSGHHGDDSSSGGTWTRVSLSQDEDVLDTWFSSALWPFSTQGWPDETDDLKTYYPTATLVTAFDIIFFWVARMMMMGLHFMDEVPFRDVYIHALVLDEKGQKMSKSKGNAMDPLELIDEYGADALRFTMARMAGMGRNIRLSTQAIEGNRNFATKLWNAARFCQMNECVNWEGSIDPAGLSQPTNRWIVSELAATRDAITEGIEGYRFNEAAGAVYRFVWNVFCDWYLELLKPLLNGQDEAAKAETRRVAGWVLDEILKLLHPFMPFVTEELWGQLAEDGPDRDGFLMLTAWPDYGEGFRDAEAEAEIDWVIRLVSEVRSVRADLGVPPGAKVPAALTGTAAETRARLKRHGEVIERLARLDGLEAMAEAPSGSVASVLDEATLCLRVAGLIDPAEEVKRLDKEMAKLTKDMTATEKKLANPSFVEKAPPEIVEENRERLADATARLGKLQAARRGLEALR